MNRVNAVLLHLVERQDADDDRYGSSLILETVLNATTYAGRLLQRVGAVMKHCVLMLNATTYAGRLLQRPEAKCSPTND